MAAMCIMSDFSFLASAYEAGGQSYPLPFSLPTVSVLDTAELAFQEGQS